MRPLLLSIVLLLLLVSSAQAFKTRFIQLTSPVRAGDYATISIKTAPQAWCTISVRPAGEHASPDLHGKKADPDGVVTWHWKVYVPGRKFVGITCHAKDDGYSYVETSIRVVP